MPCKTGSKKGLKKLRETASETDESNKIRKTKHACIVKAQDSILPKDHEDHIAGKGFNSISHCNLVHKCLPMPQAMKISEAKAASGQGMGEARKVACVAIEQGEEQKKEVILEAMGNSIPQHHEDHIAGKGENSLQHYNLVHKFIPVPQAMKIPAAKAAVDKEW